MHAFWSQTSWTLASQPLASWTPTSPIPCLLDSCLPRVAGLRVASSRVVAVRVVGRRVAGLWVVGFWVADCGNRWALFVLREIRTRAVTALTAFMSINKEEGLLLLKINEGGQGGHLPAGARPKYKTYHVFCSLG